MRNPVRSRPVGGRGSCLRPCAGPPWEGEAPAEPDASVQCSVFSNSKVPLGRARLLPSRTSVFSAQCSVIAKSHLGRARLLPSRTFTPTFLTPVELRNCFLVAPGLSVDRTGGAAVVWMPVVWRLGGSLALPRGYRLGGSLAFPRFIGSAGASPSRGVEGSAWDVSAIGSFRVFLVFRG
jgi:hypothetical protein